MAAQMTPDPEPRAVPIEDLGTRRQLWHGVWDWLIGECERLANEAETTPPAARRRTARRAAQPSSQQSTLT